ncbi:hypothetical protein XENOCAPTIV_007872, partial [Xenoophorus captivus]
KEATKRALFLFSRTFQYSKNMTVNSNRRLACEEQDVYLRDDREFRDKITPISVVMNYSLDYQLAADETGLLPIVNIWAPTDITKQVQALKAEQGVGSSVTTWAKPATVVVVTQTQNLNTHDVRMERH